MAKEEKLTEDQFIQEPYAKDPKGTWYLLICALILLMVAGGIWGLNTWRRQALQERLEQSPFYQVTNREMSLFLWQHSEYMRVNSRSKAAYLVGFDYHNRVGLNLESSEKIVVAPPQLLHRYHNWKRLIGSVSFDRSPSVEEFRRFLEGAPEWRPENWKHAPSDYVQILESLNSREKIDFSSLPLEVRQAFCGWKNYFEEGDAINALEVNAGSLREFLTLYPGYARHNWRNFYLDPEGNNWYLTQLEQLNDSEVVSAEEVPAFLKVAIFNWQAKKTDDQSTF